MRKTPQVLALFFIAITIGRVAAFISVGLDVGFTGWLFSFGLAFGVYISAFFVRHKESRWAALFALTFFVLTDLWFNEFELVRVLSTSQILTPDANFLGIEHIYLVYSMQFSALVFGAFPTIAAALLGWLQAGADRVAVLKSRSVFPSIGVAIAAKISSLFPETLDTVKISRFDNPQLPENNAVYNAETSMPRLGKSARWERLSNSEKAEIANLLPMQIAAKYGGSERRARMWLQWIREGKQ